MTKAFVVKITVWWPRKEAVVFEWLSGSGNNGGRGVLPYLSLQTFSSKAQAISLSHWRSCFDIRSCVTAFWSFRSPVIGASKRKQVYSPCVYRAHASTVHAMRLQTVHFLVTVYSPCVYWPYTFWPLLQARSRLIKAPWLDASDRTLFDLLVSQLKKVKRSVWKSNSERKKWWEKKQESCNCQELDI